MPQFAAEAHRKLGYKNGRLASNNLGKLEYDLTVLPHWNHGFYRDINMEIIPKWPQDSG